MVGGGRYGLNTLKGMGEKEACMEAIKASMEDFREWNQSIYNAGRPLEMRQQGAKTWEATKQRVHEYLGYLYNFKGVKRPQLTNYLDAQAFVDFMAFVTARGVDKAGHTKVRGLEEGGWTLQGIRVTSSGIPVAWLPRYTG
jgi:hypothetical protein